MSLGARGEEQCSVFERQPPYRYQLAIRCRQPEVALMPRVSAEAEAEAGQRHRETSKDPQGGQETAAPGPRVDGRPRRERLGGAPGGVAPRPRGSGALAAGLRRGVEGRTDDLDVVLLG